MSQMRHPALLSLSALLAVALIGGAWLLNTRQQTRATYEAQIAELKKGLATRDAQSTVLQADLATLRRQLAEKGIEPAVAPRPSGAPVSEAQRLEAIRELSQTQSRLSAATASLSELQNRISELESSIDRLNADNKRLSASEANLKEDLDNTQRLVAALESEVKAKNERLSQLDSTLRKARDEMAALAQKSTQSTPLLTELADINRRRENTLTAIQRRYREVTDQLRALAVRLDTQRDNPAPAVGDISRIQTAVQSAEDDMRQLNTLNARAQRISQQLSK
jgi:DNA repair exonuclease SbcCD ATPase subunit